MKSKWIVIVMREKSEVFECILDGIAYNSEDAAKQRIIGSQEQDAMEGWGMYEYLIKQIFIEED